MTSGFRAKFACGRLFPLSLSLLSSSPHLSLSLSLIFHSFPSPCLPHLRPHVPTFLFCLLCCLSPTDALSLWLIYCTPEKWKTFLFSHSNPFTPQTVTERTSFSPGNPRREEEKKWRERKNEIKKERIPSGESDPNWTLLWKKKMADSFVPNFPSLMVPFSLPHSFSLLLLERERERERGERRRDWPVSSTNSESGKRHLTTITHSWWLSSLSEDLSQICSILKTYTHIYPYTYIHTHSIHTHSPNQKSSLIPSHSHIPWPRHKKFDQDGWMNE